MIIFETKQLSVIIQDKKILKNISLKIEKGQHITLIGPSGSGKSTLLKVLGTHQSYQSGEVFYQEKELKSLNPIDYRREVSYCFQQPVLFGKTVKDNLAFPFELRKLPFDETKAIEMLQEVNLSEEFLNQEITKLSGGERQRVALIRNLMFEPKALLLDEVTTGLDKENKEIVTELIEKYHQKGMTVIQVTHDSDEINAAHEVIEIIEGEVK